MRIIKLAVSVIFLCLLGLMVIAFPARGRSENTALVGLERGERDTRRLNIRLKGSDSKDRDRSLRDQMIGAEQRRIRQERKEKELLRQAEAKKIRRTAGTNARIEKRKEEEERIRNKKTKSFRRTLD